MYFFLEEQVELLHEEDGTQRSDEPVSKSIKNFWAGVPMETVPAHSVSSSSSVRDSLWRLERVSGTSARGLISAPSLKAWRPTFFSKLIRFARCLLYDGRAYIRTCRRGFAARANLLLGANAGENGLLVVEGAVGVGEGGALRKGDADAGVRSRSRGGDERKGDGDEGGFAEHGERGRRGATKGQ